jgi:peptidoglycan/xylan/chitin deacetylase (PgdA/CDA1 family)
MLHRFADPERGVAGCDPGHLRAALAYLVKHKYELLELEPLLARLAGDGPPAGGAVAFTIDDGYAEQATVAAPLFAAFDCPVTTFVCTGFLDGALWLWWDRIEHIFRESERGWAKASLADAVLEYRWRDARQRDLAQADFIERCKRATDADKTAAIAELARTAEVELPAEPPQHYAPMTWDQVRACEAKGMRFGPHSVTHPVLSRTTQKAAEREIVGSWMRVRAEARRPTPVFCYPNGGHEDFGDREIAILRGSGLAAALAAVPGYADASSFRDPAGGPYRVQRYGFPDTMPHMIQYVSGIERLKQSLRSTGPSAGAN